MKNNKVLIIVGIIAIGGISLLVYNMRKRPKKDDNNFLNARGGKLCACADGTSGYCSTGNCDGCCRGLGGAKVTKR